MSNLRKQLQAEKDAYQATRFPGDVADEILPRQVLEYRRPEIWRHSLWRITAVALAAAAMIAIAIPVWHKLSAPIQIFMSDANQPTIEQEQEMPLALSETESLPDDPLE